MAKFAEIEAENTSLRKETEELKKDNAALKTCVATVEEALKSHQKEQKEHFDQVAISFAPWLADVKDSSMLRRDDTARSTHAGK